MQIETDTKKTDPAPTPAPAVDERALKEAGAKAERARIADITRAVDVAGVDKAFAERWIGDGTTIEKARELIFDELSKRSQDPTKTTSTRVEVGKEEGDSILRGMEERLSVRAGIADGSKESENGKRFYGYRLQDIARECLELRGVKSRGLSVARLFDYAMAAANGERALMGTGDFAQLVANVANKSMRKAYDSSPRTWIPIARRNTAADFKPMRRVQISGGSSLKAVAQHGEIEASTFSDTAENYSVATYGRRIGFTRTMFVNDDMDALNRIPRMFGARASDKESDIVWALLTSNVTMADGNALFSSAHANLVNAGSGAGVLNITGLNNMRAKMRTQKDSDGNLIAVVPYALIAPAALEATARQFTSQITPAAPTGVNPFYNAFGAVIIEPRLDATSTAEWYIAGNPDQVDVVEYSYLEGNDGPQISERVAFDVDGMEMRVLHDFGAAVLEFVSLAKSTGV